MSCNPAPSKAMSRNASFKYVSGRKLQMGCNQEGNDSMGKKVPDSRNCGNVIKLAKGGIMDSFRASPDITKPNPMNTISPNADNSIICKAVTAPLMSVKPKNQYPTKMMKSAPVKEKTMRLNASPKMI